MAQTPNRGTRFDNFPQQGITDDHGALYDRFPRETSSPHGGQYDEAFRPAEAGDDDDDLAGLFEALKRGARPTPEAIRRLELRLRALEDALRAAPTSKTAEEVQADIYKVKADARTAEELDTGLGPVDGDGLHAALVESIRKTYRRRGDLPLVEKAAPRPTRSTRAFVGKRYGGAGQETTGSSAMSRGLGALQGAVDGLDVAKSNPRSRGR